MNILWVKAGGLVPLDSGGKIRSYQIATELARRHKVTLFTYYVEHENDQHHTLDSVFGRLVTHPMRVSTGRGLGEAVSYLATFFSRLPYSISKYSRPEIARHLHEVLQSEKYDVILCDFLTPAGIIPFDQKTPVVIFTHNVEAMIWKRHWEVAGNPLLKFIFRREYRKMLEAEQDYLRKSAHVLTVSDADTSEFSRYIQPERVTTVPTGVDIDYFRPSGEGEVDNIVFTGSMDWMPNEDGIIYFAEEILPFIRMQRPDAKLWVVGRNPSRRIKALAEADAGIRITGRVDDIRPFVARASVYVVPLRVGGGTRLKIFEAMAMGKAVVSTTIGAEGLPLTNNTDIILADNPQHFANAVCRLLESGDERARIGKAARKLVEENYSWAAATRVMEQVLLRYS